MLIIGPWFNVSPFIKYWFSAQYVPDTAPGTADAVVNHKCPFLNELLFEWK